MITQKTIQKVIYGVCIATILIFIIFIVKIPVICTDCETQTGVWYRCLTGGQGTTTCSTDSNGEISQLLKELLKLGINLPSELIHALATIRKKLIGLAEEIFDEIKKVIKNVYIDMQRIYNDYIKQPILNGYQWIKDNVVLPIIQGITNYIVQPVKDLIADIIQIKDLAFRAIKSAFAEARQLALDAYDYTYGELINFWDDIPLGLVAFVEGIQDVLNALKHDIIGGVKANAQPTKGINKIFKTVLEGIESGINAIGEFTNKDILNPIVDDVVNPVIHVANKFGAGVSDVRDNIIQKTTFADTWTEWVPEPKDLFWAGQMAQPTPDSNICAIACQKAGWDTGQPNTDVGHTNECVCTTNKTLVNTNAFTTCTDVCSTIGGVTTLPAPGLTCEICKNEIIFSTSPFVLPYQFSITFYAPAIPAVAATTTTLAIPAIPAETMIMTHFSNFITFSTKDEYDLTDSSGNPLLYAATVQNVLLDTNKNPIVGTEPSLFVSTNLTRVFPIYDDTSGAPITQLTSNGTTISSLLFYTDKPNTTLPKSYTITPSSSNGIIAYVQITSTVPSDNKKTITVYMNAIPLLLSNLQTLLVSDITAQLNNRGIDILTQGLLPASNSTTSTTTIPTAFDVSWFQFTYQHNLFSLNISQAGLSQLAAIGSALQVPSVSINIKLKFSTSQLLSQAFGFTNDINLNSANQTSSSSTARFQTFELDASGNPVPTTLYVPQPVTSNVTPLPTFITYEGMNFYQFEGKYYTYVNKIFYLLKDQTGFQQLINKPNGPFSVIPISSNLNCSTTFTLKTPQNPNRIKYSYIDRTDMSNHFVSYIDIPAWPLDSSGQTTSQSYTQQNFLETIRFKLREDITNQLVEIHSPSYPMPFSSKLFDIYIDSSNNVTLSTTNNISITLLLSSNPVMCYNFNTFHLAQKDVTISNMSQLNPGTSFALSNTTSTTYNPSALVDAYNNVTYQETVITYAFNDPINEYVYNGNIVVPAGSMSYKDVGPTVASLLANDINTNTDNFYNFSSTASDISNYVSFHMNETISGILGADPTKCEPFVLDSTFLSDEQMNIQYYDLSSNRIIPPSSDSPGYLSNVEWSANLQQTSQYTIPTCSTIVNNLDPSATCINAYYNNLAGQATLYACDMSGAAVRLDGTIDSNVSSSSLTCLSGYVFDSYNTVSYSNNCSTSEQPVPTKPICNYIPSYSIPSQLDPSWNPLITDTNVNKAIHNYIDPSIRSSLSNGLPNGFIVYGEYIQYNFVNPFVLTEYTIQTSHPYITNNKGTYSSDPSGFDINEFWIAGSNDGALWYVVDVQTNVMYSGKKFEVVGETYISPFYMYRFVLTKVMGKNNGTLQINKIDMYDEAYRKQILSFNPYTITQSNTSTSINILYNTQEYDTFYIGKKWTSFQTGKPVNLTKINSSSTDSSFNYIPPIFINSSSNFTISSSLLQYDLTFNTTKNKVTTTPNSIDASGVFAVNNLYNAIYPSPMAVNNVGSNTPYFEGEITVSTQNPPSESSNYSFSNYIDNNGTYSIISSTASVYLGNGDPLMTPGAASVPFVKGFPSFNYSSVPSFPPTNPYPTGWILCGVLATSYGNLRAGDYVILDTVTKETSSSVIWNEMTSRDFLNTFIDYSKSLSPIKYNPISIVPAPQWVDTKANVSYMIKFSDRNLTNDLIGAGVPAVQPINVVTYYVARRPISTNPYIINNNIIQKCNCFVLISTDFDFNTQTQLTPPDYPTSPPYVYGTPGMNWWPSPIPSSYSNYNATAAGGVDPNILINNIVTPWPTMYINNIVSWFIEEKQNYEYGYPDLATQTTLQTPNVIATSIVQSASTWTGDLTNITPPQPSAISPTTSCNTTQTAFNYSLLPLNFTSPGTLNNGIYTPWSDYSFIQIYDQTGITLQCQYPIVGGASNPTWYMWNYPPGGASLDPITIGTVNITLTMPRRWPLLNYIPINIINIVSSISNTGQYISVISLSLTPSNLGELQSGNICTVNISDNYGGSWTPTNLNEGESGDVMAMSLDGSIQVIASGAVSNFFNNGTSGNIYISNDNGQNFNPVFSTSNPSNMFFGNSTLLNNSIAVSEDATFIYIPFQSTVDTTNGLYMSNDCGNTWTKSIYMSNKNIQHIAMSNDGKWVTCICASGTNNDIMNTPSIYVSENYGFSFKTVSIRINSTTQWRNISISPKGKYQIALSTNISNTYVSNDYGKKWKIINIPQKISTQISSYTLLYSVVSNTGQYQYIFYTTNNSIGTDINSQLTIDKSTLGNIYSYDYGITWIQYDQTNLNNQNALQYTTPFSVSLSNDGTHMILLKGYDSTSNGYNDSINIVNILEQGVTDTEIGSILPTLEYWSNPNIDKDSTDNYLEATQLSKINYIVNNLKIDKDVDKNPIINIFNLENIRYYHIEGKDTKTYNIPNAITINIYNSSGNGKYKIISTNNDTGIWVSPNYGNGKSWSNINIPNMNNIIISYSGQYQLAYNSSSLYFSNTWGQSWGSVIVPYASNTNVNIWNNIAMSNSGQYQTAITENTGIFYSNNYGVNWFNTSSTFDSWKIIAMSSTGQYQTIAGIKGICYSSDYGITFTKSDSGIQGKWTLFSPSKLTISASGKYQTLCCTDYGIYISSDYGQTWTGIPLSSDLVICQSSSTAVDGGICMANNVIPNSTASGFPFTNSSVVQLTNTTTTNPTVYNISNVYNKYSQSGSGFVLDTDPLDPSGTKFNKPSIFWSDLLMMNHAEPLSDTDTTLQTYEEDGKFQIACFQLNTYTNTKYFSLLSTDYGFTWTLSHDSNPPYKVDFYYDTSGYAKLYGISKNDSVSTNLSYYTKYSITKNITLPPLPYCYNTNITYTPQFQCRFPQSDSYDVKSARLEITSVTLSQASSTTSTPNNLLTILSGLNSALTTTPSGLILYDANVNGSITLNLPNVLLLFDPIQAPFCGQDLEFKLSTPPTSIQYRFVTGLSVATNTLIFPKNPTDKFGQMLLGQSYTLPYVFTTLQHMLVHDITSQTGLSPTFYFSTLKNDLDGKIYVTCQFDSTFTIPATLTFMTSQNMILANAFGTDGYDITISSVSGLTSIPSTTIYSADHIENVTNTILPYVVVTSTSRYVGSVQVAVNGNTPKQIIEKLLTNVLYHDITNHTKLTLPSTAFTFEVMTDTDPVTQSHVVSQYNWYVNTTTFDLGITLQFSQDTMWGEQFGLTNDVSMIPLPLNPYYIASQPLFEDHTNPNRSIFNSYKGLDYFYFPALKKYYLFIYPYLLKLNEFPTPAAEIKITQDTLNSYIAVYTSTNSSDDVYYYTTQNQIDTYYALIDERFAYPVKPKPIVVTSTDLQDNYIPATTLNGDDCIQNKIPYYYVGTSPTTFLEFQNTTTNTASNPLQLSYSYKSRTTGKQNRTITLPMSSYTPEQIGKMIQTVVTNDLMTTDLSRNLSPNSIYILYEADLSGLPSSIVQPIQKQSIFTFFLHTVGEPFQLTLETSKNTVLGSALGCTDDVVMNILYQPILSKLAIPNDPYQILYSYTDNTYSYTRPISMNVPSNGSMSDYCKILKQSIVNDIQLYCGYNFSLPRSNSGPINLTDISYDTSYNSFLSITNDICGNYTNYTFSMGPNMIPNSSITLQTSKAFNITGVSFRLTDFETIYPSTWAITFGMDGSGTNTFSKNKPLRTRGKSQLVSPTQVPYTWYDNLSDLSGSGILELTSSFSSMTQEEKLNILQTTLLTALQISLPSAYQPISASELVITYEQARGIYSFGLKTLPVTITLQFSKNSIVGINYGIYNTDTPDVTFSTIVPTTSNTPAIIPYRTYKKNIQGSITIPLFLSQGVWNIWYNNFLHPLSSGPNSCSTISCNEWVQPDPTLPAKDYGYYDTGSTMDYIDYSTNTTITLTYYTHAPAYLLDHQTNLLFELEEMIPTIFYGTPASNDFVPLTTCAVTSQGNCTQTKLQFGLFGTQTYIIIQREIKSLLPFSRDSISEPNCPCVVTGSVIPTCQEICATGNDPDGNPLLCNNPNDDPLLTPCQCYYQGPVNVIVKPMQEYNPFRLVQNLVGEGLSMLGSKIANGIKSFMLPLWHTVKIVTSYLASIMTMIVETLRTYCNPTYVFNLFKQLITLGYEEAKEKIIEFWHSTILPGLEKLWSYRTLVWDGMKKAAGYIWEHVLIVAKAVWNAIESFGKLVWKVTKTGIAWAWDTGMNAFGSLIDDLTPFIPLPRLYKTTIVFILILLYFLHVFGLDVIFTLLYSIFKWFLHLIIQTGTESVHLLYSICVGGG